MFPPPSLIMNSEVDLAVESILMKGGAPSAASPPPAETPEPVMDLIQSTLDDVDPSMGYRLLQTIQSATIPDVSLDENAELMQIEQVDFADKKSFCDDPRGLQTADDWIQNHEQDDSNHSFSTESANCIAENLIREMIYCTAFEAHQMSKLGLSFLFSDNNVDSEIETRLRSPVKSKKNKDLIGGKPVVDPMKIHSSLHSDIFGQPLANSGKVIRGQECTCPQCDRAMAATRFAPHLEKCMGMGRNSSRLASRRIMQSSNAERDRPSSTGSSASVRQYPRSQRQTGAAGTTRATAGARESDESEDASGDDDFEFDDREVLDDDDDWLTSSKRGRINRKKPLPKKPTEKRSTAKQQRNPLLGAPVNLVRIPSTKDFGAKDPTIFHLNDLLEAPPISQSSADPVSLFDPANFPGLNTSESSSPAGSETIVLRNRKVKKPKVDVVENAFVPGLEMEGSMAFDEDSRDAGSSNMSKDDKSPQVICLDDEIL